MKEIIKLTLALFVVLFFNSCRKECCQDPTNPKCENYDPCYGKTRINTNFRVRPGDRGFKPPEEWCDLIPCDTFNESSVRFDMPVNNPSNSSYEWQIGTEATPRTGKAFEVDFSDYLSDNGWERHISVTLTIRTPFNNCMQNQDDTLKVVKRDLFFSEKRYSHHWLGLGNNKAVYRGVFNHKPEEVVVIEFIKIENGSFRQLKAMDLYLITGIPKTDTIIEPIGCPLNYCFSSKQMIGRYNTQIDCSANVGSGKSISLTKLSNYMSEFEFTSIKEFDKIRYNWVFTKPSGIERYEFIGERIE
jgi:hypothetical protein